MTLNIINETDLNKISDEISSSINTKLNEGKMVLWFVTGGSSIPLQILVSKKINTDFSKNLVVTLTDERFGPIDNPESNWLKLIKGGFEIKGAKLIPILIGKNFRDTAINFGNIIKEEIDNAEYIIGNFGIGIDGHTAGILPHTEAVKEEDLVKAYETDMFDRITITPKVIKMIDEAFVYCSGEMKWPIIESLKEESNIYDKPAQVLKNIPNLKIFSDYKA